MSNKKKADNSEYAVSSRVGRSLLKFFKPIRIAMPHSIKSPFKKIAASLPQKQAQQKLQNVAKLKKATQVDYSDETQAPVITQKPLPPEQITNWLSLVMHLLNSCKSLKGKLSLRKGIQTYHNHLNSQTIHQHRTIGAIVDISQEDIIVSEEKKAS